MRLKIAGIVCLLVVLGICAWVYTRAQGTPTATGMQATPTGRYQVLSAELDFTAFGGQFHQKTVIRINTQTGQAWRLQEETDKTGGHFWQWQVVEERK